ncbi:MAG TPA: hypothetical protein VNG95_02395 [Gemmatimonadales bacterium]|nr:hypothetical protein [Gemmatimonadales bacterium]
MIPLAVLAALWQGTPAWTAQPSHATVGDTVWLVRAVPVPAGWRVRPGKLDAGGDVEPLGDPLVSTTADGAELRYPVTSWAAGPHTVDLPAIWRLGPDGRADSLPGGGATFALASVLPPDSGARAAPKAAFAPFRPPHRSPVPPLVAALGAGAVLVVLLRLRRRGARRMPEAVATAPAGEVPDALWLGAGEPKAVAARATHALRAALARTVAEAPESLPTPEAIAAADGRLPGAQFRDLRDVLTGLDQVAFAAAHGVDVAALATRARTLATALDT